MAVDVETALACDSDESGEGEDCTVTVVSTTTVPVILVRLDDDVDDEEVLAPSPNKQPDTPRMLPQALLCCQPCTLSLRLSTAAWSYPFRPILPAIPGMLPTSCRPLSTAVGIGVIAGKKESAATVHRRAPAAMKLVTRIAIDYR